MSGAGHSDLDPTLRQSLFVAGTDTGVGKTWVSTALLRALVARGVRAAGMKPVAAGATATAAGWRNEDALALTAASHCALPYEWVNPCCFEAATSPHLAAARQQRVIEIAPILRAYNSIMSTSDVIIVEGAGGWLTPIGAPSAPGSPGPTLQDVAQALRLPVLLVVGIRLGCLNHAMLTAAAIRQSGLTLAGWVASRIDPTFADAFDYEQALAQRLPAPRLAFPGPPLAG
jgi:dethiobiotin synthetase